MAKRYPARLKFQVVLELLQGDKTPGQAAIGYGIHPNTPGKWKEQFLENGAEVFSQEGTITDYERRIADLEKLLGKKEVEKPFKKASWARTDEHRAKGRFGRFGSRDIRAETSIGCCRTAAIDLILSSAAEDFVC